MASVSKSYTRKDFLMYEKMCKYLTVSKVSLMSSLYPVTVAIKIFRAELEFLNSLW